MTIVSVLLNVYQIGNILSPRNIKCIHFLNIGFQNDNFHIAFKKSQLRYFSHGCTNLLTFLLDIPTTAVPCKADMAWSCGPRSRVTGSQRNPED